MAKAGSTAANFDGALRFSGGNGRERPTQVPKILRELKAKYEEHGLGKAWEAEESSWGIILPAVETGAGGVGFNYVLDSAINVGGAGVVLRVIDLNLAAPLGNTAATPDSVLLQRAYRALKIPRPHQEKGSALAESLRDEISRLIVLSHPNIVDLYAKGQVEVSLMGSSIAWPWFVMEYLPNATDLERLCAANPPEIPELARLLYDVVCGLEYAHDNEVVHCDVKPSNMLVSQDPNPAFPARALLGDFGYAKRMGEEKGETTVGFTERFAHPDLSAVGGASSDSSRWLGRLPRLAIRPAFDLFALGMSIQHLLKTYYARYRVYERYSYELKYLKLSVARLLDGQNAKKDVTFGNIPTHCYKDGKCPGLKYRSIKEFAWDLRGLLGQYNLEHEIPELATTRRENIQVSDSAPVVLTPRLRHVVEHPLVRRLGSTTQLGLVRMVYPGATHTRLEHSLGTFGVAARYIQSLYYDSQNPLFRQLVAPDQVKRTLLAALLHDVGQYPLGHDLEDVSASFFGHTTLGDLVLSGKLAVPDAGPLFAEQPPPYAALHETLSKILLSEWHVTLGSVLELLRAQSYDKQDRKQVGTNVDRLCKSLLDGPIDADKVDYLQRDARHCGVSYGAGIDDHRLYRCLTVASQGVGDQLLLVMGVTDKGRISAESILFARYAMFTQVYWHHTVRALKALMHYAAAHFLASIKTPAEATSLRKDFVRCALLGKPVDDPAWVGAAAQGKAVTDIQAGDLRVLGWLWKNTTGNGKVAIQHILDREPMKRVLTLPRGSLTDGQQQLLDRIYSPEHFMDRLSLQLEVQTALRMRLADKHCPDQLLETQHLDAKEWRRRLEDTAMLRCTVDYPAQRAGAAFGLKIVGPWGEEPPAPGGQEDAPTEIPEEKMRLLPISIFGEGMKALERSIACLRVFWDPSESVILRRVLGDEEIEDVVRRTIDDFKPEERAWNLL